MRTTIITKRGVQLLLEDVLGDINKATIKYAKVHNLHITDVRRAFKKVLDGCERVTI